MKNDPDTARRYREVNADKRREHSARYREMNWVREALRTSAKQAKAKTGSSLPVEQLLRILETQGGVCAVSGLPFRRGSRGDCSYSPSQDRIDPNGGYVEGNVRIILFAVNALKGRMSDASMWEIVRAMSARAPVL